MAEKITKFLGMYPKVADELLLQTAASYAENVKLNSGNLVPYHKESIVSHFDDPLDTVKTIYGVRNSDGELKFLKWNEYADVVQENIYYNAQGTKIREWILLSDDVHSPERIAILLTGTITLTAFPLGLPVPNTKIKTTVVGKASVGLASYKRDTTNTASVTTQTNHGFVTGQIVSVSNFGPPDKNDTSAAAQKARRFNVKNVRIVVVSVKEFTYYNPGDEVPFTLDSRGKADIAGALNRRTYVYTYINRFGEESVPSFPSNEAYVRDGQTVTLSNLPQLPVPSRNDIIGFRVYRTISSAAGSDYFMVQEYKEPCPLYSIDSQSHKFHIVANNNFRPHMFAVGDRFAVEGASNPLFNRTDYTVSKIMDRYNIIATISDKSPQFENIPYIIGIGSGQIVYPVLDYAEDEYFWHVTERTMPESNLQSDLTTILPSENYDPPPKNMKGLKLGYNNLYVGFFDMTMCISYPNKPHAWPEKNRIRFTEVIVAIEPVANGFLVLTEGFPYIVSGSDPSVLSVTRLDTNYPCLSRRSVVDMSPGVSWVTFGGIATYSPSTVGGVALVTKEVVDWDSWIIAADLPHVIGYHHNGKYIACHPDGTSLFEQNEKTGGIYTYDTTNIQAAWIDNRTNHLYFINPKKDNKALYLWDDRYAGFRQLKWKSKVIKTKQYTNMGAARVIADYKVGMDPLMFSLWVDGEKIFHEEVKDNKIFRLPMGYKSDTFQVGIESNVVVKAIHFGESPIELGQV